MIARPSALLPPIALLIVILIVVFSSQADQSHSLIVNGKSTEVPVVYLNSRPYVDLEALAKVLNGTVSSSGAITALSLPNIAADQPLSAGKAPAPPLPATGAPASPNPGFSREFLNAGIEQMSTLREWHTALQTAVQAGIPLSEGLLQPYRAQATTNLHLVSVAISTPADRSAYDLLNNVYVNMGKLSDKYVDMRARLTYIAPDAVQNDDLNKRIITCGRFLGAMAASGQFSDDGSCH